MTRKSLTRSSDQSVRSAACRAIEQLESRVLFTTTHTISGTPGNDVLVLDYSGASYTAILNGNLVASFGLGDNIIQVNGLSGDDSITIKQVFLDDVVEVDPGDGSNATTVATGNFGDCIDGFITVGRSSSTGVDTLRINDSVAGSGQHDTLHIGNTYVYADESATIDAHVSFNQNIQTTLDCSDQDDVIYVEAPQQNMQIKLRNGVNTVHYGGTDQRVLGSLPAMTITGGVNTDTAIFDDSNGGQLNQFYNITATSVMNQTLNEFENVEIDTRVGSLSNINQINVSGIPTNRFGQTTVNGGFNEFTHIGTATNPIDLNHASGYLTVADNGSHFIDIQELGIPQDTLPHYLINPAGIGQELQRTGVGGTFSASFTKLGNMSINAGDTNDYFEVTGTRAGTVISINGGAGNDQVLNSNAETNFESSFGNTGSTFLFDGGPGSDSVRIDDRNGITGAGHTDYRISSTGMSKGTGHLSWVAATLEGMDIYADDESNNIYMQSAINQSCYIDAGAGSDNFSTVDPATGHGGLSNEGVVFFVGSDGTDTTTIDDTANQQVGEYFIFGSGGGNTLVSAQIGSFAPHIFSDSENLNLNENDSNTITTATEKPASTRLVIEGGSGSNDFQIGGGDLDSDGWINTTVVGQGGVDTIEFNDASDNYSSQESDTTNLYLNQLAKGSGSGAAVNFFLIENQILNLGSLDNTVNANTLVIYDVAAGVNTVVNGSNRVDHVTVAVGDTSDVHSTTSNPLTMHLGSTDDLTVNDYLNTDDRTFTVNPTSFTISTGFYIAFPEGVGSFALNAGDGNDSINLARTAVPVMLSGGGGNNTYRLASGNLALDLAAPVTLVGGSGSNAVTFDDSLDPSGASQIFAGTTFTAGGATHTLTSISSTTILAGPGGDALRVNKNTRSLTFVGNSGNDTITIGNGNLDANITAGGINVNGGGGTDTLFIDDHLDAGDDTYNLSSTTSTGLIRKSTTNLVGTVIYGPSINVSNIEATTLSANPGDDQFNIATRQAGVTLLGNGGADTFDVESSGSGLTSIDPDVTIAGGAGLDAVLINQTATSGTSTVTFTGNEDLASLAIGPNGTAIAKAGSNLVISTQALSYVIRDTTAVLDLNDNDLIVDYTGSSQLGAIVGLIKTGRANGAWTGRGITSSSAKTNSQHNTTLGAMEATDYKVLYGAAAKYDGMSIDNTAVLVKYTYYGDANFNGKVDGADYSRIDATFNKEHTAGNIGGWINGDFNGDGKVDGADYALIDGAFNSQGAPLRPSAPPVVSPTQSGRSAGVTNQ